MTSSLSSKTLLLAQRRRLSYLSWKPATNATAKAPRTMRTYMTARNATAQGMSRKPEGLHSGFLQQHRHAENVMHPASLSKIGACTAKAPAGLKKQAGLRWKFRREWMKGQG